MSQMYELRGHFCCLVYYLLNFMGRIYTHFVQCHTHSMDNVLNIFLCSFSPLTHRHGWVQAMAQIRPSYMKVICPTAPTMPVTLNMGFEMPSWFDLRTLDMYGPEDEEGIKKATSNIHALIHAEISAGIAPGRIFLGGFSQGGALSLHAGLTFDKPIGGIIALSCWLPLHKSFPAAKKTSDTVPIFQCHGDVDPVVPYKFGQLSHKHIKAYMPNAEFKTYNGLSHSSSMEEMNDFKVNSQSIQSM